MTAVDVPSRPLYRLARELLQRRDAATGTNRESAQSDLEAAFDAIEEDLEARIRAIPRPNPLERFHWGRR